uniref:Serine-threonine/tyrosine-protein kinase catalytic domain-containing protein n=1 Tax=Lactuca sativa TaxID=4236 RepID=A0A9R1XG26_LACSA|nr:hypothetical protein LSAT_V11C400199590 [Lactuca sativa]
MKNLDFIRNSIFIGVNRKWVWGANKRSHTGSDEEEGTRAPNVAPTDFTSREAKKQFGLNIHVSFYKYVDEAAYEHIKASVETNLKQYKLMVINHQQYDEKADVFSFVIVLWELVTAKRMHNMRMCMNINITGLHYKRMLRCSSHHRSSPKDGVRSDRYKQRGTCETRDRDRDKDRSREDRNGKGRDKDRERERDRGGDRDRERDRVRVKREHVRKPEKEREDRDQEKEKEHERPHRSGSRIRKTWECKGQGKEP